MLRPGFGRAVIGLILGLILGIALITLIRVLLMSLPFAAGPALFFGAFGGLIGWLWGIGSFNPYSSEHHGLEHAAEAGHTTPLDHVLESARHATPEIAQTTRSFIQPLLLALGVCVAVVVVFMVLGMIPSPIQRVTTNTPVASSVTPQGLLNLFGSANPAACVTAPQNLPSGSCGLIINKTLFFAILAVVVLVILGGFALVMALLMGALSNQVEKAKKSPDEPPQTEPPLFRLIDFFVSWLYEFFEGTRRSLNR